MASKKTKKETTAKPKAVTKIATRAGRSELLALVLFAGFVIITGAATAAAVFRRVTVVITPQTQTLPVNVPVTLAWGGTAADLTATLDSSQPTSAEKTFAITDGELQDAQATVEVELINTTNADQPLAIRTRLQAEGTEVIYRITDRVTVPKNSSVTVTAQADERGEAFEVGPTDWIIPGLQSAQSKVIYGKSTTAASGGEQRLAMVSEQAVAAATTELRKMLTQKASIGQSPGVVSELTDVNVTTTPELGATASSFLATATGTAVFLYVDEADLDKIARQTAATQPTPENFSPTNAPPNAVTLELTTLDATAQTAKGTLYYTLKYRPIAFDDDAIRQLIAGKSVADAEKLLRGLGTVQAVRFDLPLGGQKTIPLSPSLIRVEVTSTN